MTRFLIALLVIAFAAPLVACNSAPNRACGTDVQPVAMVAAPAAVAPAACGACAVQAPLPQIRYAVADGAVLLAPGIGWRDEVRSGVAVPGQIAGCIANLGTDLLQSAAKFFVCVGNNIVPPNPAPSLYAATVVPVAPAAVAPAATAPCLTAPAATAPCFPAGTPALTPPPPAAKAPGCAPVADCECHRDANGNLVCAVPTR